MESQREIAAETFSENMSSGEHALYDLLFPEDTENDEHKSNFITLKFKV